MALDMRFAPITFLLLTTLSAPLAVRRGKVLHVNSEKLKNKESQHAPQPSTPRRSPHLGRFKNNFTITAYVATGGQATVWAGRDLRNDRPVILRYLHGLCDEGMGNCRVEELDAETTRESRRSCALAADAALRQQIWFKGGLLAGRSGVSKCIKSLDSAQPKDPAFEVWSYAGDLTLAEGFFMKTSIGTLTIEDKRHVFRTLRHYIAVMADSDLTRYAGANLKPGDSIPCCCSKDEPDLCAINRNETSDSFLPCQSDQTEDMDGCGPIVHHDLHFGNVMLARMDKRGRLLSEHESTTSATSVVPTIIDWGAARRCRSKRADEYSEDWVPIWLDDPRALPSECWSYDTYGVGLAWLATELLQHLPVRYLVDRAVSEFQKGTFADSNLSKMACDPICAHFPVDAQLRQQAVIPVQMLISELHKLFRTSPMVLESAEEFLAGVKHFANEYNKNTFGTLLSLPPEDIISNDILPMLRECPRYPPENGLREASRFAADESSRSRHLIEEFQCDFQKASKHLNFAIAKRDRKLMFHWDQQLQDVCGVLKSWARNKSLVTRLSDLNIFGTVPDKEYLQTVALKGSLRKCNLKGDQGLMTSIITDDVDAVAQFVSARRDLLNELRAEGESWLSVAVRASAKNVVAYFLQHGADPLLVSKEDQIRTGFDASSGAPLPALLLGASQPDNLEMLKSLVNGLGDTQSPQQKTILMPRIATLQASIGTTLARVATSPTGPNLLSVLAGYGDTAMLTWVVEVIHRDNPSLLLRALNYPDNGDYPILKAAAAGSADKCRVLLRMGAVTDIYIDSPQRLQTPLFVATVARNLDAVRVVGSSTAASDLDFMLLGQGSALHIASGNGDHEIAETLISFGADVGLVDARTLEGPLHLACRKNRLAAVRLLSTYPAAQRSLNGDGETPLQQVARQCPSVEVLEAAFDQDFVGAEEVKAVWDKAGNTLLMSAVSSGYVPCIRFLLKRLPANGRGARDRTPLIVAMEQGHPTVVDILINEYKVDPYTTSSEGRPLAFFARAQRFSMLHPLVAAADPSILLLPDSLGMSVLGRWSFDGNMEMVRDLVQFLNVPRNAFAATDPDRFIDIFGDCSAANLTWDRPLTPQDIIERRLSCIDLGYPSMDQYISGEVERKIAVGYELELLLIRLHRVRTYLADERNFNGYYDV